jgi:hypothetical protein
VEEEKKLSQELLQSSDVQLCSSPWGISHYRLQTPKNWSSIQPALHHGGDAHAWPGHNEALPPHGMTLPSLFPCKPPP